MKDVAFPIYYNWYERIKEYLPLEERFEVFDALKEYYENGTDPIRAVRESLRFPVSLMYDQIVFSREKSEKASQAGKIGASVTNGKKKKKKEQTEREDTYSHDGGDPFEEREGDVYDENGILTNRIIL